MSFRRRPTEFEVQQSILLGAQISDKHEAFKEWAMQDPDEAFMLWVLDHPQATFKEMLKTHAILEFLKSTTEVTKLSMIVGSEQDYADVKKEVERLRSSVSNT